MGQKGRAKLLYMTMKAISCRRAAHGPFSAPFSLHVKIQVAGTELVRLKGSLCLERRTAILWGIAFRHGCVGEISEPIP